jgi:sugar/nucleoside kinase (ribokinase family)
MKYTLIGTILLDRIINIDGIHSDGFGGLMYTINAFRAACNADDEIIPVSRIGNDAYQKVKEYFKDDPRVNLDGLQYFDGPNNQVKLIYKDRAERTEYSLNPMEPLTFDAVKPFLNTDIIVINFISGWDILFGAFRQIRRSYSGPMYADIHSLTLERKENGERVPRQVDNIEKWIEGLDFIQSNEIELQRVSPYDNLSSFCENNDVAKKMIYNLTKGKEGSETSLYKNDRLKIIKGEPCEVVKVIDPTGCGDAYASGFIAEYLNTANVHNAVKNANRMAACMGAFHGLPAADLLKRKYDEIKGTE